MERCMRITKSWLLSEIIIKNICFFSAARVYVVWVNVLSASNQSFELFLSFHHLLTC